MTKKINELKDKKILLVNTGSIKKKFTVERLKKLGLKVIVLNKEVNWAKPYVDHWIIADTSNHQESLQAIKTFVAEHPNLMFAGVITFWEDDVLLTAKIADTFNLVGIPYTIARKARNKFLFRKFCQENNLPAPKNKSIKSKRDINFVINHLSFPLVLKPVYGSSGAFVIKIGSAEELIDAYHYIKKALSVEMESALTDGTDIVAEEYIDGDEVDIDILLQNGRLKFFSITDNNKTAEPFFIETGDSIPSSLPQDDQNALVALADQTLEKLNVQNGCIHFEAKVTPNGPVPIEVNLRMGGDNVSTMVKAAWHVDLVEYAAKIALGIYFPKIVKQDRPFTYLAGQYFLSEHSGVLSQFEIDPEIKKLPGLKELYFYKKIGDPVLVPPEGYEYLGWLTVEGDNLLDAEDNLEALVKCVDFKVARFRSTSSIGKTERKNKFAAATFKKEFLEKAAKIEKIKRNARQNLNIGVIYPKKNGTTLHPLLTSPVNNYLQKKGFNLVPLKFENAVQFMQKIKEQNAHLFLNVATDTAKGLTPVQAILDLMNAPCVGSSLFTDKLTQDSLKTRKLLSFHNIPVINWEFVYAEEDTFDLEIKYPIILKTGKDILDQQNNSGEIILNKRNIVKKIQKKTNNFQVSAYLEEYNKGQLYYVLVFGNPPRELRALAVVEYNPQTETISSPQKFSTKLSTLITEIAFDAFTVLGCTDIALVEIMIDGDNNPLVTNIEAQPLIRKVDETLKIIKISAISVGLLMENVINSAIKRYKEKPSLFLST